jgi:predicted nuclease of predicted toxin-antitoxin system
VAVRFLLDENLSEQLVRTLAPRFPNSLHARGLGLGGAPDLALWDRAVAEDCTFVTKDEDFVKLSVLRGPPPKVVWLNIGNVSNAVVTSVLLGHAPDIEAFVAHPELGFLALGFGNRAG